MAFHSLLGGVALAAAVAAEAGGHTALVGLGTALVIILHKPFDAMTVSTLMAASGCSRFSRHVLNALFALATPLGAILFYAGASHLFGSNPAFLGGALAFCAGTFLCIACADLLPELQFHSHDRLKLSLALAAGLAVAVLIGQFESSGHDHPHELPPGASEQGSRSWRRGGEMGRVGAMVAARADLTEVHLGSAVERLEALCQECAKMPEDKLFTVAGVGK